MAATNADREEPERTLRTRYWVAKFCDVHEATVRRWTAKRLIPHVRLGENDNVVRYDEDEIRAWIKDKRVGPVTFDQPANST